MWEFFVGLALFTAVWGFIRLSQGLQESESGIEAYDKLQATGVAVMKLFFSLLAVFTILYGFLLLPHVIDASRAEDACELRINNTVDLNNAAEDTNVTYDYSVYCEDGYTPSNFTNSSNSIKDLTEVYSWTTSAGGITYLLLGLIFFIAFLLLNYTEVAKKLLIGKGRRGNRKKNDRGG